MAGLASLASRSASFINDKRTQAFLITHDPEKNDTPSSAVAFQYFPESLSDTKAVSWQAKEVPGGSLPLYQWTGSGERTISFTAQFSTDIDPFASKALSNKTDAAIYADRMKQQGINKYNVDVRSAIAWVRSFMYPKYTSAGTIPPPKLTLFLPNSGIGMAGGESQFIDAHSMTCVMTQCEVTWDKFFPSGNARLATASLGFAQIPQLANTVVFPQLSNGIRRAIQDTTDFGGTTFLGYSNLVGGDSFQAQVLPYLGGIP